MATGRGIVLEQRVDQFCAFRCGEFLFYGPCQLHRLAITASEGICPVLSFGASAGLAAPPLHRLFPALAAPSLPGKSPLLGKKNHRPQPCRAESVQLTRSHQFIRPPKSAHPWFKSKSI